ncbi:hypothetical protein D5R40_01500 [Okeania hirsuta]|uniref:Uncharacterized protein n=1 Tax=Okeania hirsuta TaxID=1458930 RepID=A0A3N6NRA7_9CYAN|nr:hypothetical protein D4Z78_22390 [Okeania hirsuta]RQH56543.1 hypothetical protein D5R40_01500 [Okeania hirsuta]
MAKRCIPYFNWIWVHSRKDSTAAQRAGLAVAPWKWKDLIAFPTLCALHYRIFFPDGISYQLVKI